MSDSQVIDYLEITNSLLANRKEWEDVPEIVSLTLKAISHLLNTHSQSFEQHKTLINEQSLKSKELQLRLGAKVSKKDLESEVIGCFKTHSLLQKKEDDMVSEYEKLVKQSRYERERSDSVTAEEIKTISEIVADKKILQFQKTFQSKNIAHRLELQDKFSSLREEVRNKLSQSQRQMRQMKDRINQYKNLQSRIEESHHRSVSSSNEEKMNFLQHSNRRMNESLNHVITHIQTNYFTKEQLIKIIEGLKTQKDKSPIKPKNKEEGKSKHMRQEEADLNRIIEQCLAKSKERDAKEWSQFKQNILKEMGKMVRIEVVNNLIDTFQKDILQRYQSISAIVNKLQHKIDKSQQNFQKQLHVKSEKRPQKKSSPHKSIQSIHNSLSRLQRSISEKQIAQFKKISTEIEDRIKKYDSKLINQLDRRERHLCEVIEQIYSQSIAVKKGKENEGELGNAYEKLFQSNMFCRYLYIGAKQCKKQSCIVWEKEALNNLVDNFIWKNQTVIINSPGLYRVEVAMFGEIDSQTHLLLNGEPVVAIDKPHFLNTASKKAVGGYFHQFLLLPSKSRLSVRVNQHFYGQAVLSLQKL